MSGYSFLNRSNGTTTAHAATPLRSTVGAGVGGWPMHSPPPAASSVAMQSPPPPPSARALQQPPYQEQWRSPQQAIPLQPHLHVPIQAQLAPPPRPSSASAQSAQSHAEWGSASRAASELDHHAAHMLLELERAAAALPRQMQVRVERWAVRLSGLSAATLSLQRDRDDYLRLLLEQVQRRQLSVPFDRSPPDGPLPRLPPHLNMSRSLAPRNRSWNQVLHNLSTTLLSSAQQRSAGAPVAPCDRHAPATAHTVGGQGAGAAVANAIGGDWETKRQQWLQHYHTDHRSPTRATTPLDSTAQLHSSTVPRTPHGGFLGTTDSLARTLVRIGSPQPGADTWPSPSPSSSPSAASAASAPPAHGHSSSSGAGGGINSSMGHLHLTHSYSAQVHPHRTGAASFGFGSGSSAGFGSTLSPQPPPPPPPPAPSTTTVPAPTLNAAGLVADVVAHNMAAQEHWERARHAEGLRALQLQAQAHADSMQAQAQLQNFGAGADGHAGSSASASPDAPAAAHPHPHLLEAVSATHALASPSFHPYAGDREALRNQRDSARAERDELRLRLGESEFLVRNLLVERETLQAQLAEVRAEVQAEAERMQARSGGSGSGSDALRQERAAWAEERAALQALVDSLRQREAQRDELKQAALRAEARGAQAAAAAAADQAAAADSHLHQRSAGVGAAPSNNFAGSIHSPYGAAADGSPADYLTPTPAPAAHAHGAGGGAWSFSTRASPSPRWDGAAFSPSGPNAPASQSAEPNAAHSVGAAPSAGSAPRAAHVRGTSHAEGALPRSYARASGSHALAVSWAADAEDGAPHANTATAAPAAGAATGTAGTAAAPKPRWLRDEDDEAKQQVQAQSVTPRWMSPLPVRTDDSASATAAAEEPPRRAEWTDEEEGDGFGQGTGMGAGMGAGAGSVAGGRRDGGGTVASPHTGSSASAPAHRRTPSRPGPASPSAATSSSSFSSPAAPRSGRMSRIPVLSTQRAEWDSSHALRSASCWPAPSPLSPRLSQLQTQESATAGGGGGGGAAADSNPAQVGSPKPSSASSKNVGAGTSTGVRGSGSGGKHHRALSAQQSPSRPHSASPLRSARRKTNPVGENGHKIVSVACPDLTASTAPVASVRRAVPHLHQAHAPLRALLLPEDAEALIDYVDHFERETRALTAAPAPASSSSSAAGVAGAASASSSASASAAGSGNSSRNWTPAHSRSSSSSRLASRLRQSGLYSARLAVDVDEDGDAVESIQLCTDV